MGNDSPRADDIWAYGCGRGKKLKIFRFPLLIKFQGYLRFINTTKPLF